MMGALDESIIDQPDFPNSDGPYQHDGPQQLRERFQGVGITNGQIFHLHIRIMFQDFLHPGLNVPCLAFPVFDGLRPLA
jgi:hypothetical protein